MNAKRFWILSLVLSVLVIGTSYGATLSVGVTAQNPVIDAGYNTTVYANITGGNGSYSCAWSYYDLFVTSRSGNFGNSSCVAVFHGNVSDESNPDVINVNVTDTAGNKGSGSTYEGVDTRLVLNLIPQTDTIYAGNSIKFTNNTQNGTVQYTGSEYYTSYKYLNISSNVNRSGNSFFFGKAGSYKITEEVSDTNNANATAQANITVLPTFTPLNSSIYPTYKKIDLGQSEVLKANTTGGTGNYTYAWFVNNVKAVANQSTFTFIGDNPGNYNVYAVVHDNQNDSFKTNNSTINVNPAVKIQLTPSTQTILITQTASLQNITTGGEAPYNYTYVYNSNVTQKGNNFTFKYPGTYTIKETATDSFGQSNYTTATVNVEAPALVVNVKPNLTVLDLGQNATLYSNVSGGFGNYSYQWIINGVNNATTKTLNVAPKVGNYTINLNVKDSANDSTLSNNATVIVNPLPLIKLIVLNTTIYTNTTILLSNVTTYGTAPYTYSYKITPTNNVTLINNSATFEGTGSYNITEMVTDSKGKTATSSVVINVSKVPYKPQYLNVSITPENFTIHKKESLALYADTVSTSSVNNYTYAWYVKTPYTSGFVAIADSNSAKYVFDTYPQSALGVYYFKAHVTDLTTNLSSNSSLAVITLTTPASCKNPHYSSINCDNDNQEQHSCSDHIINTWNSSYSFNYNDSSACTNTVNYEVIKHGNHFGNTKNQFVSFLGFTNNHKNNHYKQ